MPVGQFRYRHEAEFAAGFLEDAGIPYRLQVDDAGGVEFGLGGTRPAVIWVLGIDADRAREVIGTDEPEGAAHPVPVVRPPPSIAETAGLGLRARGLAAGLAGVLIAVALLAPAGPTTSVRTILIAIVASSFSAIAVLGRAPKAIRTILRTLTGEAP